MADCRDIIPKFCGGKGVPTISSGVCGSVSFTGIKNVTIDQGDDLDLRSGVHAYDGNGNEINYSVTPSTIDTCTVGEYTVVYKATGEGSDFAPTLACGKDTVHALPCEDTSTVRVKRTVTIEAVDAPTITVPDTSFVCGADTCDASVSGTIVYMGTLFNAVSGVVAKDGKGNAIDFTYSGEGYTDEGDGYIQYTQAGEFTLYYETAEDACGRKATAERTPIYVNPPVSPTCFIGGTKVWTSDGLKNIEDVAIGDKVLSYNDLTEENELCEVINTISEEAASAYRITVGADTLEVTGDHRMYLPSEQIYEAVNRLSVGDELLKQDGSLVPIDSIEEISTEATVYNLNVDALSNYYVGTDGYLSYNMNIADENGISTIRLSPRMLSSAGSAEDGILAFSFDITQFVDNLTQSSPESFNYLLTPFDEDTPQIIEGSPIHITGNCTDSYRFVFAPTKAGVYEYKLKTADSRTATTVPDAKVYKVKVYVYCRNTGELQVGATHMYGSGEQKAPTATFNPRVINSGE